jgi:hypothetical protein
MGWLRERGRFVIAAERAGISWFVGVWKYLAPPVAIAGFAGLGGWLAGRVSLWLVVAYALTFLVLLFIEGAFSLWRAAAADLRAKEAALARHTDHEQFVEVLSAFFTLGNELRVRLSSAGVLTADVESELSQWGADVEDTLRAERSHLIPTFRSDAARPAVKYYGSSGNIDQEIQFSWWMNWLDARLERLNEIIARVEREQ